MAIYGYVRNSLLRRERSPEGQIAEMARKAEELGGSLNGVFVDPGSPDKAALLDSPAGKEMLPTLQAGDTLIVNRLDRLGYSMRDVRKTVEALADRQVTIHLLDAIDGEWALPPDTASGVFRLFNWQKKTEKRLRSERGAEQAKRRKEEGLAYAGVPTAQKIVKRNGVKVLEWDMKQLGHIAEIAERLPKEGAASVAKDFWKRRVRDRRGRIWGKQKPKPISECMTMLRMLTTGRLPRSTPYKQFHRAAQWFQRMKRKGLLPPPYGELALMMQEPEGFRE